MWDHDSYRVRTSTVAISEIRPPRQVLYASLARAMVTHITLSRGLAQKSHLPILVAEGGEHAICRRQTNVL